MLINELKSFPMMGSEHRLVVLKEAQYFSKLEELCPYLENPNPSTIFVVCYKHKKYDQRKSLSNLARKMGLSFIHKKLKNINSMNGLKIIFEVLDIPLIPKGIMLLSESLGNDLGRIVNEVEKLGIILKGRTNKLQNRSLRKILVFQKTIMSMN